MPNCVLAECGGQRPYTASDTFRQDLFSRNWPNSAAKAASILVMKRAMRDAGLIESAPEAAARNKPFRVLLARAASADR